MNGDELVGWFITVIGLLFALVMLLRGTIVWGSGNLLAAGIGALVVAGGITTLWLSARLDTRRVLQGAMVARVDSHGQRGPASMLQRFIGRHEVGHVVGAEATGMGVASVEIGDGYGYVRAARFTTVDDAITFLAAGHLAVHSKSGAGHDLANIRRLAAELPRDGRKDRLHTAIERARRETSRQQDRIRRDGHRLADTGRW